MRWGASSVWLPPTKFRAKIWESVMGIGPYALWGDEGRHAESSCPMGRCVRLHQLPRQRSERGKRSWSNSIFAR